MIKLFMREKKARKIGIFTLLGTCLLISLLVIHIISDDINNNGGYNKKMVPRYSTYYLLDDIHIDDDDPDSDYHSWGWRATNNDWCTESGGVYYIRNVVISGGGYIDIRHSDVNFVIENCTVYNSNNWGIRLRDVDNGRLINNSFLDNTKSGIFINPWNEGLPFFDDGEGHDIEIWNNIINNNIESGIEVAGNDASNPCYNINITDNTILSNLEEGISFVYVENSTIESNECSYNGWNGIKLSNSHGITINNNDCHYNYVYNGIFLYNSYNNTISANDANNNDEAGIKLENSGNSLNINTISTNTVEGNENGIYIVSSNFNYIGTSNTATSNTKYGIYISDGSHDNTISGNTASSNGIWNICYDDECEDTNTFTNNNVKAINVDNPPSGGGFPIEYLFTILFLIFFVAVIGSIGYLSRKKNIRLREQGVVQTFTEEQPRVVFVRPGLAYQDQSSQYGQHSSSSNHYGRDSDHKPITPKEIEPYEFYCAKCDQKSLGYQVFCSTCGERMRQPKLAAMHDPNEKVQCVICHSEMCPSCNHEITGDDACYEECPYCERSYHKHCWEKTMQGFGKCGFCLETPPPELIPNYYK